MASYNFFQGIVPLCVTYSDIENPNEWSDITPMAFQRAFWRVRNWTLALSLHWEISGDDGYHNSADATPSHTLYGPGKLPDVAPPFTRPPADERELYRLSQPGIVSIPDPTLTVSYLLEDGSTLNTVFLAAINGEYYWSAYNRVRASKWSDNELRVRSFVEPAIGTVGSVGIGNGVGDTASGADAFALTDEPFPLVWENGAPGGSFFATIPSTVRPIVVPDVGGHSYSASLTISGTLVPLSYWEWDSTFNPTTGAPV